MGRLSRRSNPAGSLEAFLGEAVPWRSRKLVLTNAALIVADCAFPFGPEAARTDEDTLFFAAAVLFGCWMKPAELAPLLQDRGALLAAVNAFRRRMVNPAAQESVEAVDALLAGLRRSACRYAPPAKDKSAAASAEEADGSGQSRHCTAFALCAREYGWTFEEFLGAPATRTNTLVYAALERAGFRGKDTFRTREDLAAAEKILAHLKFD